MRRKFWITAIAGLGLVTIGICSFVAYLRSPYRIFRQIVNAIERKDIDTVYEFILEEEKKMGITKEIVHQVLNDILYKNATVVKACRTPLEQIQGRVVRDAYWFLGWGNIYRFYSGWMDGMTSKPFPSFRKITKGVMTLRIELYRPSGRGWQMSFTQFALSYIVLNFPRGKAPQLFRLFFKKWGISAIYDLPPHVLIRGRVHILWDKPRWREVPP